MNKKMQSQLCFEISSVVRVAGNEFQQKIIASDLYIYTEVVNKQLIYLPETQSQYFINNERNQLIQVDLSAQIAQFMQMKQIMGELSVREKSIKKGRQIHLSNSNSSIIHMETEANITKFPDLEKTVYHAFEIFNSKTQPVVIQLQPDEIITSLHTTITVAGKIQESSMEILDIKLLEDSFEYDKYLSFSIS